MDRPPSPLPKKMKSTRLYSPEPEPCCVHSAASSPSNESIMALPTTAAAPMTSIPNNSRKRCKPSHGQLLELVCSGMSLLYLLDREFNKPSHAIPCRNLQDVTGNKRNFALVYASKTD